MPESASWVGGVPGQGVSGPGGGVSGPGGLVQGGAWYGGVMCLVRGGGLPQCPVGYHPPCEQNDKQV